MRYAEGAILFYRELAAHLLVEIASAASIQLVVPRDASPPEEDQIGVARALATRKIQSLVEPPVLAARQLDPAELLSTPLVIDGREARSADIIRFRNALISRADVVVLVRSEVSQLGCRVVYFDRGMAVFGAVTSTFVELIRQLGFSHQAIEVPARFLIKGLRGVQADFHLFEEAKQFDLTEDSIDQFCTTISRGWRYCGEVVSAGTVSKWVGQFKTYGVLREALALLEYLNRDGYIPKGEIINKLVDRYAEVSRSSTKPKPVSIQRVAKSEAMLLYDLRQIGDTPPLLFNEFVQSHSADHFVCFDDVIGSGATVLECLFDDQGSVDGEMLKRWLSQDGRRITIIVAIASEEGIRAVEQDSRCMGRVKVLAARVLSRDETVFGPASRIFDNPDRSKKFRNVCAEIGEHVAPGAPLGWGDCQWCIVTDYNAPDCTIPAIWARGNASFAWMPLFPRR